MPVIHTVVEEILLPYFQMWLEMVYVSMNLEKVLKVWQCAVRTGEKLCLSSSPVQYIGCQTSSAMCASATVHFAIIRIRLLYKTKYVY